MDGQILRDLFAACIQRPRFWELIPELRSQLPRPARACRQSNRCAGQLQSGWKMGPAAPEIHHRMSQSLGPFPQHPDSLRDTPALAGRATLVEIRGDDARAGLAWRLALGRACTTPSMRTRFSRVAAARAHLSHLSTTARPSRSTAISRYGGDCRAAVTNRSGEIELLPALPAWPTGAVKGLRAQVWIEVDLRWKGSDGERHSAQQTGGKLWSATAMASKPSTAAARARRLR